MGLLDDAIREHLELKRRRGADPDEVARQENEALGPPRTAQFAEPEGEEELAAAEPEGPAAEEPPEEPWLEEHDEPDATRELEAVELDDDEPAPPGEDVLEETPEFLQETPEHDRLWFEQRPPRDFDFDK